MSSARPAPRWHFLLTPKWLGWHAFVACSIVGMLWLGNWQFHRAEAGNALSWAYTFEWPVFAVFAVVFWAKTIIDEFRPASDGGGEAAEFDLPGGAGAGAERQPGQAGQAADDQAVGVHRARHHPRASRRQDGSSHRIPRFFQPGPLAGPQQRGGEQRQAPGHAAGDEDVIGRAAEPAGPAQVPAERLAQRRQAAWVRPPGRRYVARPPPGPPRAGTPPA